MSKTQSGFNSSSSPPSEKTVAEFFAASASDDVETVNEMLCNTPGLLEARDNTDATPLIVAAQNGSASVVRGLLEAGADLDAVDSAKMDALCRAAYYGQQACCDLLIDFGADPSQRKGVRSSAIDLAMAGDFPLLSGHLRRAAENIVEATKAQWRDNPVHVGTGQPVRTMKPLELKPKS